LHPGLFGTLKVEGNCKKETKIWSYKSSKHLITKMVSFGIENQTTKIRPDDEDDDVVFFYLDLEIKPTSLEMHAQGTLIDLDSMPDVQVKGSQ
jgi:hypothetical protein